LRRSYEKRSLCNYFCNVYDCLSSVSKETAISKWEISKGWYERSNMKKKLKKYTSLEPNIDFENNIGKMFFSVYLFLVIDQYLLNNPSKLAQHFIRHIFLFCRERIKFVKHQTALVKYYTWKFQNSSFNIRYTTRKNNSNIL